MEPSSHGEPVIELIRGTTASWQTNHGSNRCCCCRHADNSQALQFEYVGHRNPGQPELLMMIQNQLMMVDNQLEMANDG